MNFIQVAEWLVARMPGWQFWEPADLARHVRWHNDREWLGIVKRRADLEGVAMVRKLRDVEQAAERWSYDESGTVLWIDVFAADTAAARRVLTGMANQVPGWTHIGFERYGRGRGRKIYEPKIAERIIKHGRLTRSTSPA